MFRYLGVSKQLLHRSGTSRFSVESFSSHGTENLRNGTLLCFINFPLSKEFLDKHGGMGDITIFFQNFCCRTVPINFVGEPFSVSELFRYR